MTLEHDNPDNYDDPRWIILQADSPAGDWNPIAVCSDRENAGEALLSHAPPVRVQLAEAEEVVGLEVETNDGICGAETTKGGKCQNPEGSCPVPSHD